LIVENIEEADIREEHFPARLRLLAARSPPLFLAIAWVCVAALVGFYVVRIGGIGVDLRNDFWDYWENNRFYPDINSAMGYGLRVLREAQEIEQEDPQGAGAATIANPGPGLFDSPRSMSLVIQRWQRLRPVYWHIYRGWVRTYEHLDQEIADGEYQMDYPPLRCMVMTLWAWKVQTDHPGIEQFPRGPQQQYDPVTGRVHTIRPDIARPLLLLNMFFEAVSSVAMFFLVWIWMRRGARDSGGSGWRARWGDPLLLAPVICLLVASVLRPHIGFSWAFSARTVPSPIDDRITNVGWWIFLVLRFVSVVALAHFLPRPFRGILCGLMAATLVWINPATIIDSYGWPQWEAWLPPFFLTAAVLVSLDWWMTAGVVLALGIMFKGQLLLISPVLVLCPLFVGWFGRFVRIVVGMTAGAGLVVWPWLVVRSSAQTYIIAAVYAAVLICIVSIFRKPVLDGLRCFALRMIERAKARWHGEAMEDDAPITSRPHYLFWVAVGMALITAGWLSMLIYHSQARGYRPWTVLLTLSILTVPWFIPRRFIFAWMGLIFSASLWLAAASLGGSFSWWDVGFFYGTQKHQKMQLGQDSLSNLTSLLENRYRWNLHDAVGSLHLPLVSASIDLDVQTALLVVFGLALVICATAAGIHLRRNDKRFLVALLAPWVLFVTVLTQMAARYMVLAAVISAGLVAIGTSVSLLQLLLTGLACVMLGNQLLAPFPNTAPVTYSITRPTFPDAGWLLVLLAAVVLCLAVSPSERVKQS
jgi:hypothetical protein